MSLLTSRTNQERLWRIINQNEKITRCFSTIQEKQQWFRHIIGYFDDTFTNVQFIDDLKSVNTQILQYMAQDIKTRLIQVEQSSSITRIPPMLSETPPPNPPDVSSQPSTQVSSQLPTQEFSYEEREREYRKLLEKPQPQNVPNFQEEFSTSSISNSDLQQLEQQRTQDVSINSATNPVGAELLELRSQMDTQNKQCQELEKLQKQQKQIQIEMQSEIQQLHNQLETCMDIIKSYQSNTVLSDHLPKLSELQIAEPKTDSDIQNALEEIIVSVESS